jgi:uncharacterized protein YqiB (DUF1249 family)
VGPRFHALHQFIDHELATMRTQINEFQTEWLRTAPSSGKSSTHLNEVFRSIIKAE